MAAATMGVVRVLCGAEKERVVGYRPTTIGLVHSPTSRMDW